MKIYKYDIYRANLNPKKGSAQAGIRPVLIIQSNVFNHSTINTVVILPLTTNIAKVFPSEVMIEASEKNGLKKISKIMGSQITVLDKKYLIKKLGTLEDQYHNQIIQAIDIALDREDMFFDN